MQFNTRILAHKFEYLAPKTLTEALDLLSRYQDKNIKVLAGGTDLLVKMKTIAMNVDYLMNIKDIPELNFIDTIQGLTIGATIPLAYLLREDKVRTEYTALSEGIQSIAAPAIRNMATVAGNIGNASPAADTVPPLIAFGAKVIIESKQSKRTVLLEEFFTGPGKTILKPDELITRIEVPEVKSNAGSAFLKKSRVKADLAKINIAVSLQRNGQKCESCKIVFGSVAATAVRASKTEKLLAGEIITEELIAQAAQAVTSEIKPISDIRSTAEYRILMSREMLSDTLKLAWARTNSENLFDSQDGGE
ncbi:MAG: xanthine dehydrogenase family protein subunit M [Atribacterota bacterium]|nr:xanthine dehydrogenase family protein subunit M [Atribacterota bacterium]MDD5636685.1 xanthine dehydrogenase family protein subunit M [Atribacterota bacterium]